MDTYDKNNLNQIPTDLINVDVGKQLTVPIQFQTRSLPKPLQQLALASSSLDNLSSNALVLYSNYICPLG